MKMLVHSIATLHKASGGTDLFTVPRAAPKAAFLPMCGIEKADTEKLMQPAFPTRTGDTNRLA
jgi:hypothetical protein